MNMSPIPRRVLNFSSGLLQAGIDIFIHQVILSAVLALTSESLEFQTTIFFSGIIAACYAFNSLYGIGILYREFWSEKHELLRAWTLIVILSVLFAFTSEIIVPFFPVMMSLIVFMAVNFGLRYSLRHFLASKSEAFSQFTASPNPQPRHSAFTLFTAKTASRSDRYIIEERLQVQHEGSTCQEKQSVFVHQEGI